jgi:hypothetical protein
MLRVIGSDLRAIEVELEKDAPPPPADTLEAAIEALTDVIERPAESERSRMVAYYLRAKAQSLFNWTREENGFAPDNARARKALDDYDIVIASELDLADWGIVRSDTLYRAGTTAFNHLKAEPLAYSYFERCAAERHMGCVNIMAGAKLTGSGGQAIDILGAIELHALVFATGPIYGCAGAYSAESLALIAHFLGVTKDGEDAAIWLRRAQTLADERARIAAAGATGNPCGRERFDMDEYLIGLEQGKAEPSILARAAVRDDLGKPGETIVRYLSGDMDEASFSKSLEWFTAYERCDLEFLAAWRAIIRKETDLAREHYRGMKSTAVCADEMAYLRKYKL